MAEARGGNGHAGLLSDSLKRLLAAAPDSVFVTTADNRIVLWNRAVERLMGYRGRDVVGRACRDVLAARTSAGSPRCLTGCDIAPALAVDGLDQSFEMQTRTKNGEARWLAVTAFAVTDTDRRMPLVVHVLRDVTSGKRLHRLLGERRSGAPPAAGTTSPLGGLTGRELQVLRLLAAGVGTAASAVRLGVSRATIRNHVQNIFGKLGVHTRLEAVAHATRHRLL
jgi:PAS domain S-box-containing protein